MRGRTNNDKSAESPAWMGWVALYAVIFIINVYAGGGPG